MISTAVSEASTTIEQDTDLGREWFMALRWVVGMMASIAMAVALPHWAAADGGFGFPTMGGGGFGSHTMIALPHNSLDRTIKRAHDQFFSQHRPFKGRPALSATPFVFFDGGSLLDDEPYVAAPTLVVESPPPVPAPVPQACPPGPPQPTFTTEITDGVRIIRGHTDRC